jgi:energy-coupling factor transport system ATP-binding protein
MPEVLTARDVHVQHGRLGSRRRPGAGPAADAPPAATGVHAVRGVDLTLRAGDVVALMGRNGSGKTSLLWALQGSGRRSRGSVQVAPGPSDVSPEHADPARLSPRDARRRVALVPNTPQDLLFRESVAAECAEADGSEPGTARGLLDDLAPGIPDQAHPRDLSEGQRLALALAVQLAATPRVLLLDEPTRGLDYTAKRHLARVLVRHAADGGAVLLSSHDVEFVAECASRVVVMADGDLVADGTAAEVLVSSPVFAPQVAKILHPLPLLTVAAARQAMERAP